MQKDGFLIEFWEKVFGFLSKISVFYIIRKILKNIEKPYSFVEKWVLGNLIFSIICSLIAHNGKNIKIGILIIVAIYSFARIFEIIVYQINVLLFDKYRYEKERKSCRVKSITSKHRCEKKGKIYKVKSITRMVILLMHNYIEIVFWYASLFMIIIVFNKENPIDFSWAHYIKGSILCVTTYNNEIIISERYGYLANAAFFATISGFIMTVISIARFIGLLPQIETIDKN